MKLKSIHIYLYAPIVCMFIGWSCKKVPRDVEDYFPKVEIISYTINNDESLTFTARLSDKGEGEILAVGMTFSSTGEPDGMTGQQFAMLTGDTFSITYSRYYLQSGIYANLDHNGTYYLRAFAVNDYGYTMSETLTIYPWELPTIEVPCSLPEGHYNIGNGDLPFDLVEDGVQGQDYIKYTMDTDDGYLRVYTNLPLHPGIYYTYWDNENLAYNQLYVLFENSLIPEGEKIYITELNDTLLDVSGCELPYQDGGIWPHLSFRFITEEE